MKKFFVIHWCFFYILGIWTIFASPYLVKGLVPFPSKYLVTFFPPWSAVYVGPVKNAAMPDVITQIYPWKKLTIDTWKSGQIPLWNPYSFSGTVHAANFQSAVFSPINILFFILPFETAWSWMILLQPLLAGLFMFYFLHQLVPQKIAALIGSIGFMFCGFGVVWMAYGTLFYSALFLPLGLGVILSESRHSYWIHGPMLAMVVAFSLLSGHFQISLYTVIVIFAYIIYLNRRYPKIMVKLLFFAFAGIGLSMPQLLLTIDAYTESTRSSSFTRGEIIPWRYFITTVFPDFYGNPVTRNDWFGHYAEWASYIGVIPLMFAIKTITSKFSGQKLFFVLVAISALLFAYQGPLVNLLFALKIPVLSTSAASRVIFLFSFSMAVLSAYGVAEQITDWKKGKLKNYTKLSIFAVSFLGLLFFVVYISNLLPPEKLLIARRNILLPSIFIFLTIAIIAIGYVKGKNLRILICIAILCLASFDSLRFALKWMPYDPSEYMYPQTAVIRFLTEHVGTWRILGNLGGEVCVRYSFACIDGYDAMYQARYGSFIHSTSDGTLGGNGRSVVSFDKRGKYTDRALQILGVKYIVHRKSDGHSPWAFPVWDYQQSDMKLVYKDEYYEVYEYIKAKPRVYLGSNYTVSTNDAMTIQFLYNSSQENIDVILEHAPQFHPVADQSSLIVRKYSPQEIVLDTNSPGPKLLIMSDTFSTGWKAIVDARQSEILRANYDFRAISIPGGSHKVRIFYWPDVFSYGLIISTLSLLLILSMGYVQYRNENRIL